MPAFETIGGMPFWIDISTSDAQKTQYFYSQLLGWEFEGGIARVQGLPVAGLISQENLNAWVTSFLSDDLEGDCVRVAKHGGRVLVEPTEVQLGRMAVLADATGALFGLIEPAGEEAFVAAGEPGTMVWHELYATTAYEQVQQFYAELLDWDIASFSGEGFGYATAMREGGAFAGIRDSAELFPPGTASFWQPFVGVEDAEVAARRVAELGGEVIRQPYDSEFGRLTLIADSCGAAVMLCEIEPYVEEDPIFESDDILNL